MSSKHDGDRPDLGRRSLITMGGVAVVGNIIKEGLIFDAIKSMFEETTKVALDQSRRSDGLSRRPEGAQA